MNHFKSKPAGRILDFAVTDEAAYSLTKKGTMGYASLSNDGKTLTFMETESLGDKKEEDKDKRAMLEDISGVVKITAGDGFSVGYTRDSKIVTLRCPKEEGDSKLKVGTMPLNHCHHIIAIGASSQHCFALCEVSEGDKIEAGEVSEQKLPASTKK